MQLRLAALFAILLAFPQANTPENLKPLLDEVSYAYVKLEPQTIRPAEGYLKYDHLIPAGFYKQMWDWDGFFIGSHLAHQNREQARYLKWWVLSFASAIDKDGYVPGILTTKGLPGPKAASNSRHLHRQAISAQGAVIALQQLGDYR